MEPDDAPAWPTAGEVAIAVGTARSGVADALQAARERWHKSADLNAVRTDLRRDDPGRRRRRIGPRSWRLQLLAARGSTQEDVRERSRRARAVLRAAVELEASVVPDLASPPMPRAVPS